MKKNKLIILFFVILCISCSKKSKIEDTFITSENYYWQYNNECHPITGLGAVNFKFDDNGLSHQFSLGADRGYVLVEGESLAPKTWLIKNDSILSWGNLDYKINHIDRRIIILEYQDPRDKNKFCYIRLLKVADDD
jgi:hypothetical protein